MDHDEGRVKCQPRNVYAVSDQQDLNDNVALRWHEEELQEVLEQATEGIAALAAV